MPGTTVRSPGAAARGHGQIGRRHRPVPPQPAAAANLEREASASGGASVSLVRTVTPSTQGAGAPAADCALGHARDRGPQHGFATLRVNRGEGDAEAPEDPGGPRHRGGDVVQLEVEEDPVALDRERRDGLGPGRPEQLETHLRHPEPGPEPARQAQRHHQVVDVEGQGQAVAGVRLSHRRPRAGSDRRRRPGGTAGRAAARPVA